MKKLIISIIFLSVGLISKSQQYTTFSGYVHDHYFVNPGAAGSSNGIRVGIGYKNMLTGFHNSPEFNMFSADAKINDEMGAGGKVFTYRTGPMSRFGFEGTYTYSFQLGSGKLSLGLSALLYQLSLDKSNLDMKNPEDEVLYRSTTDRMMVPDAAFGVYYHAEKYFAGISAVQLFGRRVDMENNLEMRQERHYYLMGGYSFDLGNEMSLIPSLLVRFNETMLYQGDLNIKFKFRNIAFAGVSYRANHNDFIYSPGDAVVGMLGIDMGNLLIGYSYDYLLSDISNYSNGSHELIVVFKIGDGKGATKL
jgi:type IX secretion system PorP/SprF family membrane protein